MAQAGRPLDVHRQLLDPLAVPFQLLLVPVEVQSRCFERGCARLP